MSGFFKLIGVKPAPAQVAGVRIQSSIAGLAIPIVYGTARISGNLIDYVDWSSSGQGGKRGKQMAKMGGDANTYKAAVVEALCEGPIQGLGMVWADKDNPADFGGVYVPDYGWALFTGSGTQAAWSYMTTHHSDRALPYQYTAYVANPNLALPGDSTPHYTWEVIGLQRFGAAKSAAAAHTLSGASSSSFNTSLTQADGYFDGGIIEFTKGALSGYIGQVLSYVNASGHIVVAAPFPTYPSSGDTFTIYPNGDCLPSAVITDALTDVNHGLEMPSSMLGDWTSFAQYCQAVGLFVSPVFDQAQPAAGPLQQLFQIANSAPFWSDGTLKVVPYGDTAVTGNGVTWTPNSTPVYDLTDDDFLGTPPVTLQRTAPAQAFNRVTVDYEDRGYQYNTQTQEAKDDAAIAAAGRVLSMPQLSFRQIKVANVARTVAQLALQRVQFVRNTYKFTLPIKFALLEPMDLVTLTDAGLGLSAYPVRLTSVNWTETNTLECEAEDWPFGTATAALYGAGQANGYITDADVEPGPTAAPFIVEAPTQIATSPRDLFINVSGGEFWGGCDVYVSQDNATFTKVGQIINRSNYGTLTATLPSGAAYPSVDTANTASVDLTTSLGALVSQPDAAFLQFVPLCYVDGEWICYEAAALTSAYHYNLTHLYRGLYGTASASHASGTPFAAIDLSAQGGTFRLAWPNSSVGDVLHFKFPAFNVFGKSSEDISTVTSYAYTIGQASVTVLDAIPQGTVSVDAAGASTAHVDGPSVVASYRYAYSTSGFPSTATTAASGSIANGRVVDLTGPTLSLGDTLYWTIVPFTGASAAGAELPAINLIGSYQSFSVTKTAAYAAAQYTQGQNPVALPGTTNSLAWVIDTGTLGDGSLYLVDALRNPGAGQPEWLLHPVLPNGVTITQVQADVYLGASVSGVPSIGSIFSRIVGNVRTPLASASTTSATGWQTLTVFSGSEDTTGNDYHVESYFRAGSTTTPGGTTVQRLGSVYITYTMPSPPHSL